ncbi:MAG: hypothetical protein DRQ55_19360, partial [Planctomycetota bacterium]
MKLATLVACLLATTSLCSVTTAQQLVFVPDGYVCTDITPDGKFVVGNGDGGAFRWDWKNDAAPTFIGGNTAVAVSDDGMTILGHIYDPPGSSDSYAGIWTQLGGWQSLGTLGSCDSSNSSPYDLSGDGLVAVGLTWAGCSGRGFRWTAATGMEALETLGNGGNRASVTNDDGSVIGGFAQGNFSRTPARWAGDLTGSVYDMEAGGELYGMNNDGSTVLGAWNGEGFILDSTSFNSIGSLNNGWVGRPQSITEDGTLVAGYDTMLLASQAWLWKQSTGFVSMDDVLVSSGILGAPAIYQCRAMTDDGNIIVG